jgi:hypothetical protein
VLGETSEIDAGVHIETWQTAITEKQTPIEKAARARIDNWTIYEQNDSRNCISSTDKSTLQIEHG